MSECLFYVMAHVSFICALVDNDWGPIRTGQGLFVKKKNSVLEKLKIVLESP